jgi:cyclopropane-fatty-acyl-phospholipid synthase
MKPSIIPADTSFATPRTTTWLQTLGRAAVIQQLEELTHGQITVIEDGEQMHFGKRSEDCTLNVKIEVLHPQVWADVAYGGTTGAGEAYINGYWRCEDLTALVRMMVVNRNVIENLEGKWTALTAPLRRILHWANRNSKDGSRRNIAAHYDLGNDFFSLFLDPTMAYSCGIFAQPDTTLHAASLAKFEAICRKLDLQPSDHLVEIGTGWGGFAIYAAQYYGCKVTTTTISKEQYAFAEERIRQAGLSDRIDLRLDDYRDLTGHYDKLVSIEMIEAVGHHYLDTYFSKCSSLLKPNGAMLLQAITIQDQIYEQALETVDFIQRFIFPGSFIPSVTAISESLTRSTDMKIFHCVDIGPHYATTLRLWREAFAKRLDEVRALGYPDAFIRMWEFYLCYCEGGFEERQIGDMQILLTKPRCRVPNPSAS